MIPLTGHRVKRLEPSPNGTTCRLGKKLWTSQPGISIASSQGAGHWASRARLRPSCETRKPAYPHRPKTNCERVAFFQPSKPVAEGRKRPWLLPIKIMRRPLISKQVVQARMWSQGFTIGITIAAAAVTRNRQNRRDVDEAAHPVRELNFEAMPALTIGKPYQVNLDHSWQNSINVRADERRKAPQ